MENPLITSLFPVSEDQMEIIDIIVRTYRVITRMEFLNFFKIIYQSNDESINMYILYLAIRYGIINENRIRKKCISSNLQEYREFINSDTYRLLECSMKTPLNIVKYSNDVTYFKIIDIPVDIFCNYLIARIEVLIRSIPIDDFLQFAINDKKTKNICDLIKFTNGLSRIVEEVSDFNYLLEVIRTLLDKYHYYLITMIILGIQEVPKKYQKFINELSDVNLVNNYQSFLQKISVKSTDTSILRRLAFPFIGILFTEIIQTYEMCNGLTSVKDRLAIVTTLYDSLELLNKRNNIIYIDNCVHQLVQKKIDSINLYRKEMLEWTTSDVQIFLYNVLNNDRSMLTNIDQPSIGRKFHYRSMSVSVLQRARQDQDYIKNVLIKFNEGLLKPIDGLVLQNLTVKQMYSMKINKVIARRIRNRVKNYKNINIVEFDSIHDVCMAMKKHNINSFQQIIDYKVTPSIFRYIDDKDLTLLNITPEQFSKIKKYRRSLYRRNSTSCIFRRNTTY